MARATRRFRSGRWRRAAVLAAAALAATAALPALSCMPTLDGVTFACRTDPDCPGWMVCDPEAGRCVHPDAGAADLAVDAAGDVTPADPIESIGPDGTADPAPDGPGPVDASPEAADAFVPDGTVLCRPCRLDADCAGTAQALCVEYGPQGRWCGIDCETAGCPAGFDCVDVPPGAGRQCRVAGADCPCDDEVAGLPTTCYVENAFGRCAAERTCEEDCPAPVPAAETCDGADDDCDGTTDEDATDCTMRYRDGDGDGWGVSSDSRCLCVGDAPYTAVSPGDCDDARPEVHPEAPELCNTRDDDCDAATDEGLGAASPGTGCATKGLCAGKVAAACVAGEWACDYTGVTGYQPGAETSCDAFDNDCDGATDEEFALDGPAGPLAIGVPCGTGACAGGKVRCRAAGDAAECSTAGLASAETCDQKDNDCDGVTDPPGLPGCATYYKDGDQDGYGEEGSAKCICFPAKPWTTKVPGDCDDANPQAHPSRKEDCATAFDDDCDGATDVQGATGCTKRYRDEDGDGWGTSDAQCWCGTPGTWRAPQPGDCDDADANVHPGGAVCGKDGSCDGLLTDAGEPCDDQNAVAWDGCNACNIVEFQVNSTATGAQGAVRLAHHGDAAFVAVWEDSGRDGAGYGIVGRRYMGDGSPVGGEFAVNTYTSGDQREPAVAGAAGQGFVAAWRSNGQDGAAGGVYAQRYAADGTAAGGEFRVNSWTTNTQSSPAVAMAPDGRVVVAWQSQGQDGGGWGVFAQRYDAVGAAQGSEAQVNTTTAEDQSDPAVARFADGRYVVVWTSRGQDGSGLGVYGRRFKADGAAESAEFRVHSTTADDQAEPAVATFPDGRFVVVWTAPQGAHTGIRGQRFLATGASDGAEFQANAASGGIRHAPALAVLSDGRIAAAWGADGQDGSGFGVVTRLFDAAGSPAADEVVQNRFTAGAQDFPALAVLPDGRAAVAWSSADQDGADSGVFAAFLGP